MHSPALETADHAVIQIGRHNHAVARRIRKLGALGGNALGHGAPGPVVAHRATVSSWLELGQALHLNKKLTVCRGLHTKIVQFVTVLRIRIRIRIRIRQIRMFLSLLDSDPDPLVRGIYPDPDLDPSIIMQK